MKKLSIALTAVCLILALVTCGGGNGGTTSGPGDQNQGGGSNPPPVNAVNLTGNWEVTATSTVNSGSTLSIVGYLAHSGTTISGTVHIVSSNSCFPGGYIGGVQDIAATGTVSGNSLTITTSDLNGQTITIAATAQSSSAITGTYSITGGCAGGDKGSVSGFAVPPLTGKWTGTFTVNGDKANVSADLVQGTPLHGLPTIKGTVSFTGSSCFSGSGIIRGDTDVIGGTHLFLRINSPSDNPTQQVQLIGTTNQSGTSITVESGDLSVNFGTCNNQSGSAALQKQ